MLYLSCEAEGSGPRLDHARRLSVFGRLSTLELPALLNGAADLRRVRQKALRETVHGGYLPFLWDRQSNGRFAHGLSCVRSDHRRRDVGMAPNLKRSKKRAQADRRSDGEAQPVPCNHQLLGIR